MPASSSPAFTASTLQSIAGQLACPACHGGLSLQGASLLCSVCARAYPIVDGIPVLIVERAIQPR